MRIAVVGSRGIDKIDFSRVGAARGDVIITGGAKGVDLCAEKAARANALAVEIFRPDYARFGRAATHIRNRKIIDRCDRVIAFWDGRSKGTSGTIDYARKTGKPVAIVAV